MTYPSARFAPSRSSLLVLPPALALALAGACAAGDEPVGRRGPVDAGTVDAGATDAGTMAPGPLDAGPPPDDAGPPPDDAGPPPDDAGHSTIAAPAVEGEPRADHRRPSWIWTAPTGATGYRVRIDSGAWVEVPSSASRVYTAPSDLPNGVHIFEVQARDSGGRYGATGRFETLVAPIERAGDTWWRQSRVMATSPHGHVAAISAHNCYQDGRATAEQNLSETISRVRAAQVAGADLIELDLVDGGSGRVLIAHDDNGATARASLADVLDDPALAGGDQVLFLEIKETTTAPAASEAFVRSLLDILAARRASYARAGRHVVLRAFHALRQHLDTARALLDSDEYVLLRPYVRLSVLFSRNAMTAERVNEALAAGYDMVEPEYRSQELMARIAQARMLGLGVNIWTVPTSFGEVYVANARESVDAITVDYPIASARAVVRDDNALFYVDASPITDSSRSWIPYRRTGTEEFMLPVGGAGQPLLRTGSVSDVLPGGRLAFVPAASRSAALYDADARPNEGVFLATVVRFGTTAIASGATMSVIAKSNSGGWALELANSGTGTVLRFGVHVGGSYRYATYPASSLTTSRSHFITCAYDGDGGVRMWIDNDDSGVTVVSTTGGITNNDVPVTLGADPEAGGGARFYFDGEIQMALAQAWGNH